jgi:hypothetical protein
MGNDELAITTHQQLAGHLASHRRDLILAETSLHQVGDEQLEPIGRARVAGLAEIGRENEVLRADGPFSIAPRSSIAMSVSSRRAVAPSNSQGKSLCVPKIRFCNIGDEVRQGQAVM